MASSRHNISKSYSLQIPITISFITSVVSYNNGASSIQRIYLLLDTIITILYDRRILLSYYVLTIIVPSSKETNKVTRTLFILSYFHIIKSCCGKLLNLHYFKYLRYNRNNMYLYNICNIIVYLNIHD